MTSLNLKDDLILEYNNRKLTWFLSTWRCPNFWVENRIWPSLFLNGRQPQLFHEVKWQIFNFSKNKVIILFKLQPSIQFIYFKGELQKQVNTKHPNLQFNIWWWKYFKSKLVSVDCCTLIKQKLIVKQPATISRLQIQRFTSTFAFGNDIKRASL